MSLRRHRLTNSGYTFVEVLTSAALASILLAISVPELPTLWAQFQIGGTARKIAVDLQRARMKAVGENAFYRVVFAGDGSYIFQKSADGSSFADDGRAVWLPNGIAFHGELPRPTFNRLGVLNNGVSVTVTNTLGQMKTVEINILGKITIS